VKNISCIVENAIKKHSNKDFPKFKEFLSSNLEFRLLFSLDMSKKFKDAKKSFIKNYLNDLLTLSLGNISLAARKARVNRRHLHRIINDHEINPEQHRKELLKPLEYMKENVHSIIEETLSEFDSQDIKDIYTNMYDISEIIAKDVDNMTFDDAVELFEKEYIENALKSNGYNISKTADVLEVSERTLYRKITKLAIICQ